jgi:hypothetical protein
VAATEAHRPQNQILENARTTSKRGTLGPILSPHRLGPDFVSFAEWMSWPEVTAHFPEEFDEGLALAYLRDQRCFEGSRDESSAALQRHIKQSPFTISPAAITGIPSGFSPPSSAATTACCARKSAMQKR